jgi:hypothetical protein
MARAGFEADRLRLMLHERKTGTNRELLVDFDASAHELRWTSDSQRLFFTGRDPGHHAALHRTALADGEGGGGDAGPARAVGAAGRARRPHGSTRCARRWNGPPRSCASTPPPGDRAAHRPQRGHVRGARAAAGRRRVVPTTDGKKIHAGSSSRPASTRRRSTRCCSTARAGRNRWSGSFSRALELPPDGRERLRRRRGRIAAACPASARSGTTRSRSTGAARRCRTCSVCDAMRCARSRTSIARAARRSAPVVRRLHRLLADGQRRQDRFAAMIAHCGVFNLESMYGDRGAVVRRLGPRRPVLAVEANRRRYRCASRRTVSCRTGRRRCS